MVTVSDGQSTSVNCTVVGLINPTVSWKQKGSNNAMNTSQPKPNITTLHLAHLSLIENGTEYVCSAVQDEMALSKTITLIVLGKLLAYNGVLCLS